MQLASPALEARHWQQVFAVLGQPYEPEGAICVARMLRLGVLGKLDEVQAVTAAAAKEFSMLRTLEKMEAVRCPACVNGSLQAMSRSCCWLAAGSSTSSALRMLTREWRFAAFHVVAQSEHSNAVQCDGVNSHAHGLHTT